MYSKFYLVIKKPKIMIQDIQHFHQVSKIFSIRTNLIQISKLFHNFSGLFLSYLIFIK